MPSATLSAPVKAHKSAKVNPAAVPADDIIGNGPTMQEELNVSAAPIVRPTSPVDAPTVDAFVVAVDEFAALISGQHATFVNFYILRGRAALKALNIKLGRSKDKATRTANRASVIKGLTATAELHYDAEAEPKPKVDRWIAFAAFVELVPGAANVPSVKAMAELVTTMTRIDPPASWEAQERYELKREFTSEQVNALVDRVISENLTGEETAGAIEALRGRVVESPETPNVTDTTGAADAMAKKVMEAILSKDIDGFRFVATFEAQLRSYGYRLAETNDNRGESAHKLVKLDR
jgi:hypothetical protein